MKKRFLKILFTFLIALNLIFCKESFSEETNTTVSISTFGFKDKKFDFGALSNRKFTFHFEYTDDFSNIQKIYSDEYFLDESTKTKDFKVDFPIKDVKAISIIPDLKDTDRVFSSIPSSFPKENKLNFNIELFEITNTKLEVKYNNNYYGLDFSPADICTKDEKRKDEKTPERNFSKNFKIKLGDNVKEVPLPLTDKVFDIKKEKSLLDEFSLFDFNKNELSYTIDEKKMGVFGDDIKYEFNIEKEKNGQTLIELKYMPKVFIRQKYFNIEDDKKEYEHYKRHTFIAKGTYKGMKQDGMFLRGIEEYYLYIRDDLTYQDKDVKKALDVFKIKENTNDDECKSPYIPDPTKKENGKIVVDDKKIFDTWDKDIKESGNVKDNNDTTYIAKYKVNGKTVPVGEKVFVYKVLGLILSFSFIFSLYIIYKKLKRKC